MTSYQFLIQNFLALKIHNLTWLTMLIIPQVIGTPTSMENCMLSEGPLNYSMVLLTSKVWASSMNFLEYTP